MNNREFRLFLVAVCLLLAEVTSVLADDLPSINVLRCEDFPVNGKGDHEAWKSTEWVTLRKRQNSAHEYEAQFKVLYSTNGIYFLFDGTDEILSASITEDFEDLWHEDVFECFLWPHEEDTVYFEYEISPLGSELPILVPNLHGRFLGWRPWHYEGDRKIQKAISIRDGEMVSMGKCSGWRAEVFIPFKLLEPLRNVPPKPGSKWRANIYRVDYDAGQTTGWDWARVGPSFHDFRNFGTLNFK